MVNDLPEQLIAQAEFLLRNTKPNEAGVRRAVSTAYYALFHLLIRDAITNWKHTDHHPRLARTFDHKRMKDASTAILKEIGNATNSAMMADPEQAVRFNCRLFPKPSSTCSRPGTGPITISARRSIAVHVAQARLAFQDWAEVKDEPLAQDYLYSLLFKDRS